MTRHPWHSYTTLYHAVPFVLYISVQCSFMFQVSPKEGFEFSVYAAFCLYTKIRFCSFLIIFCPASDSYRPQVHHLRFAWLFESRKCADSPQILGSQKGCRFAIQIAFILNTCAGRSGRLWTAMFPLALWGSKSTLSAKTVANGIAKARGLWLGLTMRPVDLSDLDMNVACSNVAKCLSLDLRKCSCLLPLTTRLRVGRHPDQCHKEDRLAFTILRQRKPTQARESKSNMFVFYTIRIIYAFAILRG